MFSILNDCFYYIYFFNIQNKHPNECVAASADLSNNATPPVKWSQTDSQQIACTEDLLDVIAENYLPIHFVSSKTFVKFMSKWNPSYTVPCRQTITTKHIPKRCEYVRTNIEQLLQKTTDVCLTVDLWTSRAQNAFMGVTAHCVVNYKLESVLLACKSMDQSHTADHIAQVYQEVVASYNLINRVATVVTDNASNMIKAFQIPGYDAGMSNIFCIVLELLIRYVLINDNIYVCYITDILASDAEEDYDSDASDSSVTYNEEDLHLQFEDDSFEDNAHSYSRIPNHERWTVY